MAGPATSPSTARRPGQSGLILPTDPDRPPEAADRPEQRRGLRRASIPPGLSWRVLVVEDDASIAGALRAVLTRRGWDVTTAGTVAEALERLENQPHCVVLDLMLPDGSGIDVLERVRSRSQRVRVVVTTGSNDGALLKQVRQFEPDAVLRKPIDLAELLDALGPCRRADPT